MVTTPFVPEDLITDIWRQLRPNLPKHMVTSIDYNPLIIIIMRGPGLVQHVL